MTQITRRSALFAGISLVGASATGCKSESVDFPVSFNHGVASGDPGADRMVIWTRITAQTTGVVPVRWEMSTDAEFRKGKRKGKTSTDASRDYTVKIDVTGLKPGRTYYYRFKVGQYVSQVGRTKTLPAGSVDKARFAVVSCSNYPFGYFNVYKEIAKHSHFDAVLHLGDYYYEYGTDSYGGKTGRKLGRNHEPAHEIITLSDYRTRHAQYKNDPGAQAVHAAHPFICIWDDHEVANNSWKDGAQNHNAGEGSWDDRKSAALKAYYEWMPVRDPEPGRAKEALYRDYNFGDLLSLHALETRLTARVREIDYDQYADTFTSRQAVANFVKNVLWDNSRELLGAGQKSWLARSLKASKQSGKPWRLIANQIMMAPMLSPDLTDYEGNEAIERIAEFRPSIRKFVKFSPLGLPINLDAWDGYPAARERFYALAKQQGVQDLLVLTGDTHVSWANTLRTKTGDAMGVELGVTGTTSPGYNAYFKDMTEDYTRRVLEKNPDIHWAQAAERGYIDLTVERGGAKADFISVSTTHAKEYETFVANRFKVAREGGSLKLETV